MTLAQTWLGIAAVGLHGYATQTAVYWNQLTATVLTTSVPLVAAFLAMQQVFSRTLTTAGRTRRTGAVTD